MSYLSYVFNVSNIFVLFYFGTINIILLILSLYYFCYKYTKNETISLLFLYLILSYSSEHSWVGTGFYSFSDLILIAHYPKIFSLSLMLISLTICMEYIEKNKLKYLTISFFLTLILFNSHLLTGFIYFIILHLLLLNQILKNRYLYIKEILLVLPLYASMIILLYWPYYNWITTLKMAGNVPLLPIIIGKPIMGAPTQYSINYICKILHLYDFGLIFLVIGIYSFIKNKDIFLITWTIFFILISFSFLFPIKIPLSWRFIPYIKIPLSIGVSNEIVKVIKKSKNEFKKAFTLIALGIICIYFLIGGINKLNYLFNLDAYNDYVFLTKFNDPGSIILTYNAYDSYVIQGITDFSVLIIPLSHADKSLWNLIIQRKDEIKNAYHSNEKYILESLIEKYNINYVLLLKNERQYDYKLIIKLIDCDILYSNDKFLLIKIKN